MRNLVIAAALAASVLAPAHAADRYGRQKVVYHLNQPGGEADTAYLAALGNVRNHIAAVGKDNIEVKVVMHGDGVGLLKDARSNQKLQAAVVGLKGQNVAFLVCNNTLKGRKIDPDRDLFDVYAEDIVPSGVAELSHLQQQGFTYVRP
ncbi:MAG: DsrE family protein [Pseudomonadota bacterium]